MKYFERLFDKEDEETVERILQENPIYQNQGHDQMRFGKSIAELAAETFRMIEIIRDPVDLIDAWEERIGNGIIFTTNGFDTMHQNLTNGQYRFMQMGGRKSI